MEGGYWRHPVLIFVLSPRFSCCLLGDFTFATAEFGRGRTKDSIIALMVFSPPGYYLEDPF